MLKGMEWNRNGGGDGRMLADELDGGDSVLCNSSRGKIGKCAWSFIYLDAVTPECSLTISGKLCQQSDVWK